MSGSSSDRNYTIDDSQWATPALRLSEGWNMLRVGGSNEFINPSEVAVMRPLLGEFWNSSISWTTTFNASTTLTFTGTDIWAYGIRGPLQGSYVVELDNRTVGTYSARAKDQELRYTLYEAHGLASNQTHRLTLRNNQVGGSLAFDYAQIAFTSSPPATQNAALNSSSAPAATSASTSPASRSPYSSAQLAALRAPYQFHWNASAYFVVIFACLLGLAASLGVMWVYGRVYFAKRRSRKAPVHGESYLIRREGPRRERPTTKLLAALRGKRIGPPIPSDDGSVEAHSYQVSDATIDGDADYHKKGHGW